MVVKASIKKTRFFKRYVEIINVLFNLSNRETDVLALLMELDYNWHNDKFKNILDTSSRKYVMKETYVNKSNLSRYIASFKDKGILSTTPDGWEISKKVMPVIKEIKDDSGKIISKGMVITFNINIEDG